MRKLLMALIALLYCFCSLISQDTVSKPHIYRIWLHLQEPNPVVKGFFYEIGDTSVMVSRSIIIGNKSLEKNSPEFSNVSYPDIKTIMIRKKGAVGGGVIVGALAGILVGAIIGFAGGDDESQIIGFTAEDKAIIGAFVGAAAGIPIGAGITSAKIKIPINGNHALFSSHRNSLAEKSWKKEED